jgi:DNA-binding MarR family transcriptional regulator
VKKEDPGVEAFGAFLRAHAVVLRKLEDELEGGGGVPLGWYDVLLTLERAAGRRLRMQELGDAVVLSRSRVSRIVDELERQGFVTRESCETDRRVVYASITRPGRVALRHAIPSHLRAIDTYFSSVLTDDELMTIRRALERVAAQTTPAR